MRVLNQVTIVVVLMSLQFTQVNAQRDRAKTRVDTGPAWSADGNWITFSSYRDGNYELYKMRADGKEITRLSENDWEDQYPVLSHDGKMIVFSAKQEGNFDVFVASSSGGNPTNLTRNAARDGGEYSAWSPDDKNILFTSSRDGKGEIYIISVGGNILKNLTDNPAQDMMPSLSKDGKFMAFSSDRAGKMSIHIMELTTGKVRPLTDGALDLFADWSPDGKQLVFQRRGAGGFQLFKINADGSGEELLSAIDGTAFYPKWSPDGKRILFMSALDGDEEIYTLELASGKVTQLTHN